MIKHPADGLYATSFARLEELDACQHGRMAFLEVAEQMGMRVYATAEIPISQELLARIQRRYHSIGWLLQELYAQCGYAEWCKARSDYHRAITAEGEARAVMDLLLARAKSEGLVSK